MQHRAGTTFVIHFLFTLKRDRVSYMARIVPIMQHSFSLWGFSPPCSYSHTGLQNLCSGSNVFSSWCNRQNWCRQYGRLLHRRRKHCPMSALVLWQTRKKKYIIKWMNSQKDGDASFMYPNKKIIFRVWLWVKYHIGTLMFVARWMVISVMRELFKINHRLIILDVLIILSVSNLSFDKKKNLLEINTARKLFCNISHK